MPLPGTHSNHPVSGLIFETATGYGPYSFSTSAVLTFLGTTLVDLDAQATNYRRGSNGMYYKASDESGPFARNATGFYIFLA